MIVNRRNSSPKPANRGAVRTARSAVDHYARAQQERTVNGLAVQGYPCQYFSYKRLGQTCTCSQSTGVTNVLATLPTTPGVAVLDTEGNASPNHIRAMLQGSTLSINRYGSRHQGQGAPTEFTERTLPEATLSQSLSQHNKTTDAADGFAEILDPTDDLDALLDIDGDTAGSTYLAVAGSSGCGVCLGTSFVGGYNLVNGHRAVYDTQSPWATSGFVVDESVRPHTWKQVTSPAQIQLITRLPLGATSVRAARLWNNKDIVRDYLMEVQTDTGWVPADPKTLLAAADGLPRALRITPTGDSLVFTHLELVFNTQLNPVYVEWSRLTESENPRLPENMEPVSVVISPTVPNVRMRDILIDSVYDRVWLLTSVTNLKDRQSRPQGWEAQARLVQRFEFPQLLSNSVLAHRHPEFSNAAVPAVHNEDWSGHQDVSTK